MKKSRREKRELDYSDARKAAQDHENSYTPKTYKVPEGMKQFRFRKEKTYRLEIIPFRAGKGNPTVKEGKIHYERTFYDHGGVGPDNERRICNRKTHQKDKCFPCEHVANLNSEDDVDKELVNSKRSKQRQLYLVLDHGELEAGVQIFETAYYKSFGELLDSRLKKSKKNGKFFRFGDEGMTLKVQVEEDSYNGKKFYKPTIIDMVTRKDPDLVPESLLDEVPCLDELLVVEKYDKLKSAYLQDSDEDDDDEDEPKKKKKKGKSRKDDDEDEEDEDEDDEDEEDDDEDEDDDDEDEDDEGDEDEDDDDDDSDDDDDDEDEEDEDEEDEGPPAAVGDKVSFKYKKKTHTGKVTKVNEKKELIEVDAGGSRPNVLAWTHASLKVLKKGKKSRDEDEDEDDEDEEEEDEDDRPTRGKKKKQSSKRGSRSKDEDEDDEDEDDEDEDDEDDEPPARKKKKGKGKKKKDDDDDIPF